MSNDTVIAIDDLRTALDVDCSQCPLRRLDLFNAVSDQELAVIDAIKQADLAMPAGSVLIAEGADGSPLFTLRDGWAMRFKTLPDGRRQILNVLLPGDFIGLQQRMTDAASHGVQALTAVRVCRFPRDAVWRLHRELPSLGYDVTWLAANENALVDDNLLSVGRRSATERTAALLLSLYVRAMAHERDAGQPGVAWPLTRQHVADALGLSLVHIHRALRGLRQRGLVDFRPGPRLLLPDPAALAQVAKLRWPLQLHSRPLI
jgi:CRP/FNR family transcriptional regulator